MLKVLLRLLLYFGAHSIVRSWPFASKRKGQPTSLAMCWSCYWSYLADITAEHYQIDLHTWSGIAGAWTGSGTGARSGVL